jgi:hypothetical protein
MIPVSFMVQKFARWTRHSRSKNGVASLAFGWSEFLNHDTRPERYKAIL